MIQNYLKIAWRNLLRHKSFSLINIAGLAIGIAACLIIFLYVYEELTYDQYNAKTNRIVRITTRLHTPESDLVLASSPQLLGEVLKKDYPEVESVARLINASSSVKFRNDVFAEPNFYSADQPIFSVFSFNFLEGSANDALKNPASIVITKSIASKYFGDQPALGKILHCNNQDMQITGVVEDRPSNSDMKIDALLYND